MLDYRVFTFIKVCETLNFTQAAKELHITQPAVTKHIKALETEYQTKLFTFSGKYCQLTQIGKELLDLLTTMDTDIKHFKTQLKQDLQPLNFGATLTIGEYVLTDSLVDILANHPNFQVKMLVDNTETLLKAIDKGEIDFALIEGFFSKEKYDFLPYRTEPFIAVTSPDSPLASGSHSLEELLNYPIIVREQGSGTREMLEITLKEANLTISDFSKITEIGSLNTICELVRKNLGITFVYQSVVQKEISAGNLKKIDLTIPAMSHDFTFIWRKNSHFKNHYQDIFQLFF